MIRFWLSLSLLIAMLGGTLINSNYLTHFTDSLTVRLEGAEELAERGVWDQALSITQQCLSDWEEKHAYLHVIARHSDTDEILISFRSVLQSMKLEEMDEYAAKNLELITHLTLLAEIEHPDWLNIL